MTRVGRGLLALVLLAVAGGAGLLALDTLRWRGQLEEASAVYATGSPDESIWRPDALLPGRPAERLLAVEDDVSFRQMLQQFRRTREKTRTRNLGLDGKQLLSRTELEVSRQIRDLADAERRSQALVLGSILLFEGAQSQGVPADAYLLRTVIQLRQAVRLDPGNEQAQDDLEAVLRMIAMLPHFPGLNQAAGETGPRSPNPGSSGAASAGEGW